MDLHGWKIILGSNSPRRRELLAALGVDFTLDARTSFVEEIDSGVAPEQVPVRMAEGKSLGFHRQLAEKEILITSDTVVICGGKVMGKPKDETNAVRMLKELSGLTHKVVTAVTLRTASGCETVTDTSEVTFRELTSDEILYYVSNYRPLDKAGAYGIQEWIGYVGITSIKGSYYNIMGFPLHKVYEEIVKFAV